MAELEPKIPGAESPICEAPAEEAGAAADVDGLTPPAVAEPSVAEQLSACAAQRDEYLALAQRTQADFENYRKRTAREAALAESRGVSRVVRELLPAIDNVDRALLAAAAHDDVALADGMRLVRDELLGALARSGIESYAPLGERFDPAFHEAVAQHHVAGTESGTIVEVYQSGYLRDAVVIRPARVVVAGKAPPPAAGEDG